jgi:hypothetical protein
VLDALRHLGLRRALALVRDAPRLIDPSLPWIVDNNALGDLLLPDGCRGTDCDGCGHCARVATRAVRPRPVAVA